MTTPTTPSRQINPAIQRAVREAAARDVEDFAALQNGGPGAVLRSQRARLGLSQSALARRSGVARHIINEVENGKRDPSLRTWRRLGEALGTLPISTLLEHDQAARPAPDERDLALLAGCIVAGHGGPLAAIADGCETTVATVRERLSAIAPRLAACGYKAVEDGVEVRLMAFPWVQDGIRRLAEVETEAALTGEVVEALLIVGMLGTATLADVEQRRGGEQCASMLRRTERRGLLENVVTDPGRPARYRLTAVALGLMGFATLEALQAHVASFASQ